MPAPVTKPKVIFTAPRITESFMRHDIRLLSRYVDVLTLDLSECQGLGRSTYYTRFLDLVRNTGARVVLCYFVLGRYTPLLVTLARLAGCKVIVFTGGIDTAYVPDIHWGDMRNPLHRGLYAYVIRLTDSVLPFSDSSRREVLRYGRPKRVRTAHMAVDTGLFRPAEKPKDPRALTAAYFISKTTLLQKGIGSFIEAAALVSGIEFVVHGQVDAGVLRDVRRWAPSNVRFTLGHYERRQYAELLQSATVYVQASAYEGFGVALAEAMACECVPVATDRYSLPEVVGDTGYLVPFNDVEALAGAIREAVAHPERGVEARRRVAELFGEDRRERLLREELEWALGKGLTCR